MTTPIQKTSVIKDMGLYGLVAILGAISVALYVITMLWVNIDASEMASERTGAVMAILQQAQTPDTQELLRSKLVTLATDAQRESAAHEILFHISLALAVAAVLLLLVEIRVKRLNEIETDRHRTDMSDRIDQYKTAIADNVWNAVSGQIVPSEVVTEIRRMLGFSTIRKDCAYTIILNEAPNIDRKQAGELMLIRRRLSYTIESLGAGQKEPDHSINSSFDGSATLKDQVGNIYPRFSKFMVDRTIPPAYQGKSNITQIRHEVKMDNRPIPVLIETEELYPIEDYIVYIHTSPAIGLTVEVVNTLGDRILIADVSLTSHAVNRRLEPVSPLDTHGCCVDNRWEYRGALLPGQGFTITTRRIRAPAHSADGHDERRSPAPVSPQPSDPPPPKSSVTGE
jgi:hypothetical protein